MLNESAYDELPITKYKSGSGFKEINDPVIRESSIRIWLNGDEIAAVLALKQELKELAVGFLFSECLIRDPESINEIEINDQADAVMVETTEEIPGSSKTTVRTITSGCGKGIAFINPLKAEHFSKIENDVTVRAENIIRLMSEFGKKSELFVLTGGVHSCAWSDGQSLVRVSEDIGRHNCVDKLVGWKLMNPGEGRGCDLILSSGRISSEIASKALRARVPVVISHSAPTTGAIQLADEFGITLVGFVRGKRFNVYTNKGRIIE